LIEKNNKKLDLISNQLNKDSNIILNNIETARSFPKVNQDKNKKNFSDNENEIKKVKVSKDENNNIKDKENYNVENTDPNLMPNNFTKKKVRLEGHHGGNCCANFNKVCLIF